MLIADSIEARYRRSGKHEAASQFQAATELLSGLLRSTRLDSVQQAHVRHHRAKLFSKLGSIERARAEFERVIALEPSSRTSHASRLQLIRMLKEDPERARTHFEGI